MKADHKTRFAVSEAQRRIANLVMIGTVIEVDGLDGRARVQIGDLQTAKLPWVAVRMGGRKDWAAPEPGEQVVVLCHNGDPAQGLIVGSLGSTAKPQPSCDLRVFKTVFSDGAFAQINLDTHEMLVGCAGDVKVEALGTAEVMAPAINLTGAVKITGSLEVTGQTTLLATTVGGVTLASPGSLF